LDITCAIVLMKKLRLIPNLPKISIIDIGSISSDWRMGEGLSLKKSLVTSESFSLIQEFAKENELTMTEESDYLVIYSLYPPTKSCA
jgi:hypothetical protein